MGRDVVMKILFCTQCRLSRQLGGSKVALEIADAMRPLGWETEVRAIPAIHTEMQARDGGRGTIYDSFRTFMRENAAGYDVIDFDHAFLPFPRADFCERTLLVARSVLLLEHLRHIKFPKRETLRGLLHTLVTADRGGRGERKAIASARVTVAQADLVNVPNDDDRVRLEEMGIPTDKIVVLPYGIWARDWSAGVREEPVVADLPAVVFLGTFDFRKGCLDFVKIAEQISAQLPGCRFRMLGTAGIFRTEEKVRDFFPRSLWSRLDIVPTFEPEDLPKLLRGAALGVFPSYLEGFGMAVVEMIAAGLPVLAYRAPGPASILPAECLVETGRVDALAEKALVLLGDPEQRRSTAASCRARCAPFDWAAIGRATADIYRQAVERRRA
jgi:glycosyltransferase involved in cell wall biosynthesis